MGLRLVFPGHSHRSILSHFITKRVPAERSVLLAVLLFPLIGLLSATPEQEEQERTKAYPLDKREVVLCLVDVRVGRDVDEAEVRLDLVEHASLG